MNAGGILLLETVLAVTGLVIIAFVLMSRRVLGFGAFILGGAAGCSFWLAVWLEWFRGQDWPWWGIILLTALAFYIGGTVNAIAWSYLDDQRDQREAAELETAEARHSMLGPPAH